MKTRFQWIVGGGLVVGVRLWLGAGTIEDSGIFQSLKLGGRTNLVSDDNVDLTYNGAHYQRSVPILNNLTNGNGTNLTSLLASAVQAAQTNETTASITNKLGGFSGATGSYLGADGLFHTVTSGQTNDGTANWSVEAVTNSTQTLGNVGVGGTPVARLTVIGTAGQRPTVIGDVGFGAGYAALGMQGTLTASTFSLLGDGSTLYLNRPTGGDIVIRENNSSDQITLKTSTGNLGIATNGPSEKLEVVGNIKSSGTASFGGVATASGFDNNAPATLTPTDAGVSIDFGAANRLATCTLTGAVTFAFANQTAGRRYELFILGAGANANITWPTVSGVFPAGAYPSVAAAGKWHHLKFTCISSTSTTNIYIDGSTSN